MDGMRGDDNRSGGRAGTVVAAVFAASLLLVGAGCSKKTAPVVAEPTPTELTDTCAKIAGPIMDDFRKAALEGWTVDTLSHYDASAGQCLVEETTLTGTPPDQTFKDRIIDAETGKAVFECGTEGGKSYCMYSGESTPDGVPLFYSAKEGREIMRKMMHD